MDLESEVGILYMKPMLLCNMRNWIYPNQIAGYFSCIPPSFEDWLCQGKCTSTVGILQRLRGPTCALTRARYARSNKACPKIQALTVLVYSSTYESVMCLPERSTWPAVANAETVLTHFFCRANTSLYPLFTYWKSLPSLLVLRFIANSTRWERARPFDSSKSFWYLLSGV